MDLVIWANSLIAWPGHVTADHRSAQTSSYPSLSSSNTNKWITISAAAHHQGRISGEFWISAGFGVFKCSCSVLFVDNALPKHQSDQGHICHGTGSGSCRDVAQATVVSTAEALK